MKLTTPKEGVDSAWPLPLEMTQYVLAHLDIWSMGPPAQVCHFFQAAVANIRNGRQWPQHVIVSVLELEGAPFDYSEIAANLAGVEWGGQGNFYGEYWDKRQNFVAAREDVKRRRESATPSQLAVMEAAMKRFVGLGVLVAGGGLVLWKFDAFSNEDPGPVEHCYLGSMLLGLGWAIGKTAWGECLEAKEALSILWDDGKLLFCKPERPCPRWDEDTSFLDEEHQKLMLQALVLHDLPHPFHDIKEQASQGKISKLHYSFWHSGFVGQRPFINDAFNRTQFELAISGAVRGYRAMGEVEGLDIGALVVQKRVLKRLLWTEYRIDWCRRNARGLPQPPLASSANKTYRHPYYGTLKVPRSR